MEKRLQLFLILSTLSLCSISLGEMRPPDMPIGIAPNGGVVTLNCEAVCNNAGNTCGVVPKGDGSNCCCIGSCPDAANFCSYVASSCVVPPTGLAFP